MRPSTAKKSTLPPQTENLEDYIQTLYEHQKSCEKAGKYLDADQAKKKIVELRSELTHKTKFDIKDRHYQERQELEKAHLDEMVQFNGFWDSKIAEFDQEAAKLRIQLQDRHQEEMNKFALELEESIPSAPKESAEILSLKRQEEMLAKQENYLEAHQIQQRILSIQRDEFEKWTLNRTIKIRNILQSLKTKQINEVNALNQRIKNASDEQRKLRADEEDKIVQKYQNVRKDLESQQVHELTRLEKNLKNQSTFSLSRYSKTSQQQDDKEGSQFK